MTSRSRYAVAAVVSSLALAGTFYAGMAYAADARLDQAEDLVKKAHAITKAIESPGPKGFGGHRRAALAAMNVAINQLEAAKKFQDKHAPAPRPTP